MGLRKRPEKIPIVAVMGSSGTGKTTLIEYLISRLSEKGMKIATAKHMHHHINVDLEGKDTRRFSDAGASVVMGVAPDMTVIFKNREPPFEHIEQILRQLRDEELDLILLEGFHSILAENQDISKVVTARNELDLKRTLDRTADPILAVAGLISNNRDQASVGSIPMIRIERNGDELVEMIDEMVQGNHFRGDL